jgi:hypothetical protein
MQTRSRITSAQLCNEPLHNLDETVRLHHRLAIPAAASQRTLVFFEPRCHGDRESSVTSPDSVDRQTVRSSHAGARDLSRHRHGVLFVTTDLVPY